MSNKTFVGSNSVITINGEVLSTPFSVFATKNLHGPAKRCIIHYRDGSSYTIKKLYRVDSVPDKSHKELEIYYTRPAEGYDAGDYKVWDAAPVSKVVTIKAADVKALELVCHDRRTIIHKF